MNAHGFTVKEFAEGLRKTARLGLKMQNLVLENKRKLVELKTYQLTARIYLDEYPEQKELRKDYLEDNYLIVFTLTEHTYRTKKI